MQSTTLAHAERDPTMYRVTASLPTQEPLTYVMIQDRSKGWREGSAVRALCCSCGGPVCSQHSHGSSQPAVTSDPRLFSNLHRHQAHVWCTSIEIGKMLMRKLKMNEPYKTKPEKFTPYIEFIIIIIIYCCLFLSQGLMQPKPPLAATSPRAGVEGTYRHA